jgi:hypothetical protein
MVVEHKINQSKSSLTDFMKVCYFLFILKLKKTDGSLVWKKNSNLTNYFNDPNEDGV